ncbi:MAG: hypothetical protein HYV68_03265 [Candidatus Taylorbacteria bacterium]|nr:hypothetical protein [Candidatus Taylorbacteria bacterium]
MNTLSESEIALVIGEATELFKHVAILADGRSGCYLCLGDKKTGAPMLIVRFGDILLPEKASAYLNNAQEKCRRVVQTKTDLASETKLEKERYAGAVRGDSAIYGVSGYPEYLDEAAMLILAVRCADLGRRWPQGTWPTKAKIHTSRGFGIWPCHPVPCLIRPSNPISVGFFC